MCLVDDDRDVVPPSADDTVVGGKLLGARGGRGIRGAPEPDGVLHMRAAASLPGSGGAHQHDTPTPLAEHHEHLPTHHLVRLDPRHDGHVTFRSVTGKVHVSPALGFDSAVVIHARVAVFIHAGRHSSVHPVEIHGAVSQHRRRRRWTRRGVRHLRHIQIRVSIPRRGFHRVGNDIAVRHLRRRRRRLRVVAHRGPVPDVKLEVQDEVISTRMPLRHRDIFVSRHLNGAELALEQSHLVHVPLVQETLGAKAAKRTKVQVAVSPQIHGAGTARRETDGAAVEVKLHDAHSRRHRDVVPLAAHHRL